MNRMQQLQARPRFGAMPVACRRSRDGMGNLPHTQLGIAPLAAAGSILKVASAIPGIGKLITGSRRPESDLWDAYKGMAGSSRGHEFEPQFRNGAFVGLMRLKKNTFPPRQSRYGSNDDARFLDDMAAQIVQALRAGVIGAGDDANSVYAKVIGPWVASMGDWSKSPQDWQTWMRQILIDQIDAYLYDLPIVATSYTTSRHANPRLSDVVKSMQPTAPAPVQPAGPSAAPAPVTPTGQTPVPAPAVLPWQAAQPGAAAPISNFFPAPSPAMLVPGAVIGSRAPNGALSPVADAKARTLVEQYAMPAALILGTGVVIYLATRKKRR